MFCTNGQSKAMSEHVDNKQQQYDPLEYEQIARIRDVPPYQLGNRLATPPTVIKNICELPASLLHKIIGYVQVWHHPLIRETSRHLQRAYNSYVLHEFRKNQHNYRCKDAASYKSCALTVIKLATEVYVHSGFESIFCACLMNMLRNTYKDPFCPDLKNIKMFLLQFYELVRIAENPQTQRARLLFSLTLLRFFKHFDAFKIISIDCMPRHLRIFIQLKGPWFGLVHTSKSQTYTKPELRCNLLVVLAELLICNKTLKSFKNMWESKSQIYVSGNDITDEEDEAEAKRISQTLITFVIYGSSRICTLFRSCFGQEAANLNWPKNWPSDEFTIKMEITCKAATKLGFPLTQSFDISPFQEHKVEKLKKMA